MEQRIRTSQETSCKEENLSTTYHCSRLVQENLQVNVIKGLQNSRKKQTSNAVHKNEDGIAEERETDDIWPLCHREGCA